MTQFESMVNFLDRAWVARDQIVPCLIGPVGIGKTAAVHQHAKNVGAGKVVTLIVSQILPNEVSGITMPEKETQSMEIYDHKRLSSLQSGDILFFDELFEGSQYVLSACLTLIESRMMMSGKKLPDIQIIAATNPTIAPTAIKESIRQRFMFKNFNKIDPIGTKKYILGETGLTIPNSTLSLLKSSDSSYNFLTPRSLTKLASWISKAKDKSEACFISLEISEMWSPTIGNDLLDAWEEKNKNYIKEKVKAKIIEQSNEDSLTFDMSIDELVETLKNTGKWDDVASKLANINIEDL